MTNKLVVQHSLASSATAFSAVTSALLHMTYPPLQVRSLRMAPDVIRDVLEGVLLLMGQEDTSWAAMKAFLGKRSVKEDIINYDAHRYPC